MRGCGSLAGGSRGWSGAPSSPRLNGCLGAGIRLAGRPPGSRLLRLNRLSCSVGWYRRSTYIPTLGSLILLLFALNACGRASIEAEIEVVKVSGYLDDSTLRYVRDSITAAADAGRELLILQIDSRAVIGSEDELRATTDLVTDPPLPLVTWLGPAPAAATAGVERILGAAPVVATAPGTASSVSSDLESPTLRQLVQELDGETIGKFAPVRTITTDVPDDQEGVTHVPVTFTQPGLWHRFTHLGASPEGAFFFLAVGLTVAAFEYFALGPGLAAIAAALSLFLGSYGLAVLPTNPWAVGGVVLAVWLFAASYQKGGIAFINLVATAVLAWAGFSLSADPAVPEGPIGVVFTIATVLFFFLLAIPAVGRARLSTKTIGREGLLGQTGRADANFDPDGVVEINGARWPATAHRESGIVLGDQVIVTGVAGRELEVEKPPI